jgi:hypothetical protein
LIQLLNAAGEARVLRKLERFHDSIIIEGYEQIFIEVSQKLWDIPTTSNRFKFWPTPYLLLG